MFEGIVITHSSINQENLRPSLAQMNGGGGACNPSAYNQYPQHLMSFIMLIANDVDSYPPIWGVHRIPLLLKL